MTFLPPPHQELNIRFLERRFCDERNLLLPLWKISVGSTGSSFRFAFPPVSPAATAALVDLSSFRY